MKQEMELALNRSDCIKEAVHWGFNRYYSICSNFHMDVPWGFADYALAFFVAGVSIICILMLIVCLIGLAIALLDRF